MANEVAGLTKQDVEKITKQIKQIEELIAALIKLGFEVPAPLPAALKKLRQALETGKMVAEAAEEAEAALRQAEKDLYAMCKNLDSDEQAICEAKIDRQWLARGWDYTGNSKNPKSVVSLSIKKAVQKATPGIICKHWNYCSKTAE